MPRIIAQEQQHLVLSAEEEIQFMAKASSAVELSQSYGEACGHMDALLDCKISPVAPHKRLHDWADAVRADFAKQHNWEE